MYNKHKMHKGGSIYATSHSVQIFRYIGLILPAILTVYGLLIQFNILGIPPRIDVLGLLQFSFWWLYLGILQFFFPSKSNFDTSMRLITYHLLSASFLWFITGLDTPFAVCWILLMIASYIYFSKIGLQLSALSFAVVVGVDILFLQNSSLTAINNDLALLLAVIVTGVSVYAVLRAQETIKGELNQIKAQETLQRDRVSTIINNMSDAVFSTDVDGVIQVYNAASMSLLDTNVDLDGRNIDEVLPLTDQSKNKVSLLDNFKSSKTVIKRDDLSYTYEDGEVIRLEITFSPIRSSYSKSKKINNHDGYIAIMRDITKSKSLEEERDEFISVISHELRTPIAIAEGTISNAQVMMNHPDVTNDMLVDSMKTAHDQIMFLSNMVNDLSTLSRAERGVADTAEIIDVRELAHKLHDKYVESAKARKLSLDLDLSAKLGKVYVSRLYLEELLQNFITNSIKYTQKGSVTIDFKQHGSDIVFAIKDTGIGISKTDQPKICTKFYRSEDYRTRETSGTGLGLYISSKLAHKMGTRIQMVSRLNFGSTFSITLPEHKE